MTDLAHFPEALAIFAEYGIAVVPAHVMPSIGQTRAIATLDRIISKHGKDHARLTVMTLAETANNKCMMDEISLWAVSDIIRAFRKNYPEVMRNDIDRFFQFFDAIPLGQLQYWCLGLDGITSKRRSLNGMIWERAVRKFGESSKQLDLLDDRANYNSR